MPASASMPPASASVPLLAMHVLTSAMTYTTHLHALSDHDSQQGQDLMDPASAANTTMSVEARETSSLANTMYVNPANSDLGARAEHEAAGEMESQISGQGEDGEQSRTSGGCAGQHTTGMRQPPEAMSSGDPNTTTRTHKSFPHRTPEQARYQPGQGLTKVKGRTSKSGTPAVSAAQPTTQSVGSKRPKRDWP